MRLLLASASPRRARLLEAAGYELDVEAADLDERRRPQEVATDMARRLAVEKAEAIAADHPNRVVLGADTIVVFGGEPLGKPIDPDDAVSMLRKLSGRRHQAVTGWAVWSGGQTTAGRTVTDVSFRSLQDAEIAAYVASGEPLDKAGAYAPGWRGRFRRRNPRLIPQCGRPSDR